MTVEPSCLILLHCLLKKKTKQNKTKNMAARDLQNQRMIGTADFGLLIGCFPGLLIEIAPLTEAMCVIQVASIGSQRTRTYRMRKARI